MLLSSSQECYCGNSLQNNGATGLVTSASSCSVACGGDASKTCGGSWAMNVFTTGTVTTPPAPTWTSAGCFVDAATRMLQGSVQTPAGLTTESCQSICTAQGATIAGTENGNQCFCGTTAFKDGGAGVAATGCTTACIGMCHKHDSFARVYSYMLGLQAIRRRCAAAAGALTFTCKPE